MDGDDMPNEHEELDANEQDAVDASLLKIDHEADATSSAVMLSQGVLHIHTATLRFYYIARFIMYTAEYCQ